LSLSIKRVEGQVLPRRDIGLTDAGDGTTGDLDSMPELGLSEDVFATEAPAGYEPPATETENAVEQDDLVTSEPAAPDASVEQAAAPPEASDEPTT
jgi:small subunit ribosomal protein S1